MARPRKPRRGAPADRDDVVEAEVVEDDAVLDDDGFEDDEDLADGDGRPARRRGGQPGRTALITGLVAVAFVFVLAPIGIIPGVVIGVAAIVLAVRARRRADRGEPVNRRQATWGLVAGIAAFALGGIAIGQNVWYFYFTDEGKELRSCLADADGDDEAEEACRDAAAD